MITIRCTAPIFIARQLGKHQVGLTWSEVSRRYVTEYIKFHRPTEWRASPEGSIKQGSAGVHERSADFQYYYNGFVDNALVLYNRMIDKGVAPEQARMVLPQSMMTSWVWTGNLLAMAHIYNERSAAGAQLEVREFASALNDVIEPLFPVSWAALTGGRDE